MYIFIKQKNGVSLYIYNLRKIPIGTHMGEHSCKVTELSFKRKEEIAL